MDNKDLSATIHSANDAKLRILCLIAIFLSAISILLTYKTSTRIVGNENGLSWSAIQSKGEVDVYLNGTLAKNVVGADLSVFFDKNNLTLSSVTPGGFFAEPIIVRLNSATLSYSLITNPENKIIDPTKPVLKFLINKGTPGVKFYVLPSSEVYISSLGGANPDPSAIVLN